MDWTLLGLIVFIVLALGFDYTNGFHDAANAIATSVQTRALRPRTALLMAATANLVGALIATGVAETVGKGIIEAPSGNHGLIVIFAALMGAIGWNLITWWFGIPSSSSHAMIGGLVGAAVASATTVHWSGVIDKVVIPMFLSPVIGLTLGFGVMLVIYWLFRRVHQHRASNGFRHAQTVSAAAMAFSHGAQDAQKTMGVIVLSLVTTGHMSTFSIPFWVKFTCAMAISLGTMSGGYRIMKTLGRRIIELGPPQGFSAESAASCVLLTSAYAFAMPVSTTQVISTSIMGVGATKRLSSVRWAVAGNMLTAWVLTLPAAALMAAGAYFLVNALVG